MQISADRRSTTESTLPTCTPRRAARAQKRVLDLVLALPAAVLVAPLFAIVAALVKVTSAGPVLFRQERVGSGGRTFVMFKFRSMVVTDDDRALREMIRDELAGNAVATHGSFKLAADPRVTRVGRVLRATSIDELPQLINVLRGEMSLVGPRPALTWEAGAFPEEFRRRTTVPPGITGLWQVSGRSRLDTLDMLRLDLEYIDTWSLRSDLRILARTLPAVVRGDGAR
jgi:lipopolysaccharide/colanic/teichoic acid biosynthesis glycosyltransferase